MSSSYICLHKVSTPNNKFLHHISIVLPPKKMSRCFPNILKHHMTVVGTVCSQPYKWGWASEACPQDCLCKLDWSQSSLWKYSFITHHKCLIRQKVELKVT